MFKIVGNLQLISARSGSALRWKLKTFRKNKISLGVFKKKKRCV
jgi:hypothetical protein